MPYNPPAMAVPLADNPFAVLTLIAAPAVFTNASSVLSLGTGNRLARVVDRTRVLVKDLHSAENRSSNQKLVDKSSGTPGKTWVFAGARDEFLLRRHWMLCRG